VDCSGCDHANRDSAKFCEACAQPLALSCASCGNPLRASARFCDECAHPVGAPAPKPSAQPEERKPRDYTPKHLVDKILQSRSALEGERKQVSVLFADVKGSMELSEQLDPEAWHRILDRFFEILTQGVHRFEGSVNQYTGDGIMALFGAPIAHEDHAQRACYAALQLRDEVSRYATEMKREHGLSFSTRMGIHSGEVVVAAIGDDLRMDYTAQGHTVGLAQRMESLAEPNSCYLTSATARLAEGYFALEDLGEFDVKGVGEPVGVHRLKGPGDSRTRFDISRAKGLSRFVGRAADLRTLEDALDQSNAGYGQVVGVVAQAGTGKSRLCFEFLEQCRARGMHVFEGRAVAHGKNIPLLPILEVFRGYFGITAEDDDRGAREKIAGRMVLLDEKFAEMLPLLFDFLGVIDPEHPAPRIDPDARQRQLLAVMRQVIQSVSETRPMVTLIEDLHWLDAASGEFLEHMVDARSDSRSLMLVNFRPEYSAEWMRKSWYRQIPLTPLGEDAIAELLTDLLGTDPSLAGLARSIHTRTGGNPFFTEEVAQTLIESGHLEGSRGAYRLVTPVERLDVPATVQAVLAARIDRLPEKLKQLLQVASVIGKDFSEPLLAEVAELPTGELKRSLDALCDAEFIHEQAIFPFTEYSFKHPLTQEVALGSQLREKRSIVHAAVARAIERQDAEHLEERAPLLAHHYEEAGEAQPAARWHQRAADWVGTTDVAAAMHHWGRVRTMLHEREKNRETSELGLAACTQLLRVGWRVGMEGALAGEILVEGHALADSLGDRRARAALSIGHARARCAEGDVAAYIRGAIENQRAALEHEHMPTQANAWGYRTDSLGFGARLKESLRFADEGFARFPRDVAPEEWAMGVSPHSWYSIWRGFALTWLGRLPEAAEELIRCRRLSEEDGTPEMVGYADSFISETYFHMGDADALLACALRVEEISHQLGEHPVMVAHAQTAIALAHLAGDRAPDAIEPARVALDILGRVEKQHAGRTAWVLSEALLESGDLRAARSAAEHAIALCHRSSRRNFEAAAHGVLARAHLRSEGARARSKVESEFAEVERLIGETGAATLQPSLDGWRAQLAQEMGDAEQWEALWLRAHEGFEAIGAHRRAAQWAHRRG
jgi:class 3 adenylate cyclase/tetratricopeptide (TPR) repeat protein